jgi:hypothetical protein
LKTQDTTVHEAVRSTYHARLGSNEGEEAWRQARSHFVALVQENPRLVAEAIENLREGIKLGLEAWERSRGRRCEPIIESLCAGQRRPHGPGAPAYGMILFGRYAGTQVSIICAATAITGQLVYGTSQFRYPFYASYIWTPWYPRPVPWLVDC